MNDSKSIKILIYVILFGILAIGVFAIINYFSFNQNINTFNNYLNHQITKYQQQAEDERKKSSALILDLQNMTKEADGFRQQNKLLRESITKQTSEKVDNSESLLNYGLFLDEYSNYNEQFAIKNKQAYLGLLSYQKKLDDYNSELQTQRKINEQMLMRWSINPYFMINPNDFKKIGGGIDLNIPITSSLKLNLGGGYYGDWFVKVGLNINF